MASATGQTVTTVRITHPNDSFTKQRLAVRPTFGRQIMKDRSPGQTDCLVFDKQQCTNNHNGGVSRLKFKPDGFDRRRMELRGADAADKPAIRDIARRSLQASYSLGPQAITSAIEEWYGEARLDDTLSNDEHVLLVAEEDGQVIAFSESTLTSEQIGTVLWLHVDPAYRGREIGTALFDATCESLKSLDADRIHGRVLADNAEGNTFYQSHGYEKAVEESVEIAGRTYVENRYVETRPSGREPIEADNQTVYIDHDATEGGSADAFHLVYTDEDDDDLYGYYCANCGTLANAMDAMGRIECDNCGNARKPTRWDSAYL